MKLLFDQNLSPRLATRLADVFPASSHVSWVGLDRAQDVDVCTTAQVETLLREHEEAIRHLSETESLGILSLL